MSFLILISLSLFSLSLDSSTQHSPNVPITKNTVLFIFTGSDWCADCRRLEKNVLSDTSFVKTMEANQIEVQIVDFPQRKKLPSDVVKRNELIAETYNFQGVFPTLILSQTEKNYEVLKYENEKADEFSKRVLEKLSHLNE